METQFKKIFKKLQSKHKVIGLKSWLNLHKKILKESKNNPYIFTVKSLTNKETLEEFHKTWIETLKNANNNGK